MVLNIQQGDIRLVREVVSDKPFLASDKKKTSLLLLSIGEPLTREELSTGFSETLNIAYDIMAVERICQLMNP